MLRTRHDGKIERLRRHEALLGYSDEDIVTLASIGDEVEISPGTELTTQGGHGAEAFLLVQGTVEVRRGSEHLATLEPGSFVGEMSILDRAPRSATVTALTPVRALVFDPRSFSRLLHDSPHIARRLMTQVTSRLRAADEASGNTVAPA